MFCCRFLAMIVGDSFKTLLDFPFPLNLLAQAPAVAESGHKTCAQKGQAMGR